MLTMYSQDGRNHFTWCSAARRLRTISLKKTWMIKQNLEKTKNESLQCNYEKERYMRKKYDYFQHQLGLDEKTSEAIKLLMDEGLLEPLLIDLRNALEAEEYQN